jgi:hypothetical protein
LQELSQALDIKSTSAPRFSAAARKIMSLLTPFRQGETQNTALKNRLKLASGFVSSRMSRKYLLV